MNTSPALSIALAVFGFVSPAAFSQVAAVPEVAEVQAKYDEKVKLDVLRPHELAVADLNAKFAAALDRVQEAAQKKGSLDEAFAIKAEKEAILSGKYVPSQDDAKTPLSLKTMRATYRAALGRMELDRDKKLRPLKEVYAKSLEALILTMTKTGKLEEAMALKKMREDLLANTIASGADLQTPTNALSGVIGRAFSNSLGMKFIPVNEAGVLFCIHETRRQDYAAYAAVNSGVDSTWKNQQLNGIPSGDKDDHPVVGVCWEDAQKFCEWLSMKEGKTYRLPTDEEWSIAVGVGRQEKRSKETLNKAEFEKAPSWLPTRRILPPFFRPAIRLGSRFVFAI